MKAFLSIILLTTAVFIGCSSPVTKGTPDIKSISALEFSPDGTLFIGDSKAGKIFAIDLGDNQESSNEEALNITDLEGKIAALLGATKEEILIHDMAVNPVSQNVYLSVSRARAEWTSRWQLPNDLTDASVLLKINPAGEFSEASLEDVEYTSIDIPNPIGTEKEHRWKKGTLLRVDAITKLVFHNNTIYASGLSNEEFAAAMWVAPYPFKDVSATTLEIYHGAHGAYETHAPVRAFLPYNLNDKDHMLAAYLCTPLVTFPADGFENGTHLKGRTVAEFGSGNYPLDMVLYKRNGKDLILMSNSMLPLMIVDPSDVESFEGEINTEVEGYLAGVKYTPRSGSGIQQLDNYNDKFILATQRMPSGELQIVSLSVEWLMP